MRSISVKMASTDENPQDFEFRRETRRGEVWIIDEASPVTSGMPNAERTIQINDDERIVIMPRGTQIELVFDKTQNAAMPRHAFESQPDDAEKAKMEADRQHELRTGAKAGAKLEAKQDLAANAARQKVLDDQAAANKPKPGPVPNQMQQGQKPAPTVPPKPGTPGVTVPPKPVTVESQPHPAGGPTSPGPSTGGQDSKDVKSNG